MVLLAAMFAVADLVVLILRLPKIYIVGITAVAVLVAILVWINKRSDRGESGAIANFEDML